MLDVLGAVHLPDVAGPDVFGPGLDVPAHGPDRIDVVVGEVGQRVVKQDLADFTLHSFALRGV